MDIRIGNDVRIDVSLKNLGIQSTKDIVDVKCVLLKDRALQQSCTNKPFCCHGKYTIGRCGTPVYNVYPHNTTAQYFHTAPYCYVASCQHCYNKCSEIQIETNISENDSTIHMCYPADQQVCGEHSLVLTVTINQQNWKSNNTHTCTFDYGKIFRIVEDAFGKCGTILINLPKCNNFDSDSIAAGVFDIDKYKITVQPDHKERGFVTGDGEYSYGDTVKLTAEAYPFYTFVGWDDGEAKSTRVITVEGNAMYTAMFATGSGQYNVEFYDEDGTTLISHTVQEYGDLLTAPTVQIKEGKSFVGWNPELSKYVPEHDLIYVAQYRVIDYNTVIVMPNNENLGTVTNSGTNQVESGTPFTMTATPNEGCNFLYWQNSAGDEYTSPVLTINVSKNDTYTAYFTLNAPMYYYGVNETTVLSDTAANIKTLTSTTAINTSITTPFTISTQSAKVFYMMYEEGTNCDAVVTQNGYEITPDWTTVPKTDESTNYNIKFFIANGDFIITGINYTH